MTAGWDGNEPAYDGGDDSFGRIDKRGIDTDVDWLRKVFPISRTVSFPTVSPSLEAGCLKRRSKERI